MDTKKNIETSKSINQKMFTEPNLDFLDEYFTKDHQLHDATAPGLPPGRDNSKVFIQQIREAFPNLKMTVAEALGDGNKVAYRWSAEGKNDGSYLGNAPTEKYARVEGMSFDHYNDEGLVTESWNTWDALSLLNQLGISPSEPAQPQAPEQRPGVQ